MRKAAIVKGFFIGAVCLVNGAGAEVSNEWSFERDAAGLTLSQAFNSGPGQAVFSSGGAGFLETDGVGNLLCTHTGGGADGMWISGAILDAGLGAASQGIHYLRYDFTYNLSDARHEGGSVLGFGVVDEAGNTVAGMAFTYDRNSTPAPEGYQMIPVVTDLASVGRMSAVLRVDMGARTLAAWYDLSGSNRFEENAPAVSNVPVSLTSVDRLRFQATGEFRPAGSTDAVAVEHLRTASTWESIMLPLPASLPLSVHPLFRSSMVLQRDMKVPVWGRITPGVEVTVRLDGEVVGTAAADDEGRWAVEIGPYPADGGVPHVLLVSAPGREGLEMTDVVFGDVYLCSGQSNMAWVMSAGGMLGYAEERIAAEAFPLIRQTTVSPSDAMTVQEEPVLSFPWMKCSTATVPNFSTTAYYFAKRVHLATGQPVGLIVAARGGQRIERFLNPPGVAAVPELAGMRQHVEEGGITNLYDIYNAMIAPLVPCAVRGIIWYQGESNQAEGDIYFQKMQALMRGWRKVWGRGDIPFYYVQLPNYSTTTDRPGLREAQTRALSEPGSGMIVTIDIGTDDNNHPVNKIDTGDRLARWTLAKDLGFSVDCHSPLYRRAEKEGSRIRILFDHAEQGLMAGRKSTTNAVVRVDGPLQNFEIAGADRVFTGADAVIEMDSVVVSSPSVADPVYVRYCYQSVPPGDVKLYNMAGLPASPFRTDEYYRLDIKSGSGTVVSLLPGAQASVTASPPASGKVFDRWIGAAGEVSNLNSASATVSMPSNSLYLLAVYRNSSEPAYTLTVQNGHGGGTSKAGSIIVIRANEAPAGQAFSHWAGDAGVIEDVNASCTTLCMPAGPASVTAVYRATDSVGDGISDAWRAQYFGGDGTVADDRSRADADPDGDGMTNRQEYEAGTSPVEAQSVLRLEADFSGPDTKFGFSSVADRRYRLERTFSLLSPEWEAVRYNMAGDGERKEFRLDTGTDSNRFFRLRLNDT